MRGVRVDWGGRCGWAFLRPEQTVVKRQSVPGHEVFRESRQPSCGAAAGSSPRREPWVTRKPAASRGAAAEAPANRWSARTFCRPSGASHARGLTPTAHTMGYSLPLLRSLASATHALPHDLARCGVFTQSAKPGANEKGKQLRGARIRRILPATWNQNRLASSPVNVGSGG